MGSSEGFLSGEARGGHIVALLTLTIHERLKAKIKKLYRE